jgi:hypothetical protein
MSDAKVPPSVKATILELADIVDAMSKQYQASEAKMASVRADLEGQMRAADDLIEPVIGTIRELKMPKFASIDDSRLKDILVSHTGTLTLLGVVAEGMKEIKSANSSFTALKPSDGGGKSNKPSADEIAEQTWERLFAKGPKR